MKKTIIIIVSTVIILLAAFGGVVLYYISTPEYAIQRTISDVKESGIEGLKPHLTQETRKTVEDIISSVENPLISGIFQLQADSEQISFLITEISKIDWSYSDILKGKEHADVLINFDYEDKIKGTVSINMLSEEGEWKISGIGIPTFEKFEI